MGLTNNLNTWLIQQFYLHPNTSRWECCKHIYLGQTSATSLLEITVSVGIWWSTTTRWVPKLTSPIEAVTVSMYMMPIALSWHILGMLVWSWWVLLKTGWCQLPWDFNSYSWGLISYQRPGNVLETRQWHPLLGDRAPWWHFCLLSEDTRHPNSSCQLFHCRHDKRFGASQEGSGGEVTPRAGPPILALTLFPHGFLDLLLCCPRMPWRCYFFPRWGQRVIQNIFICKGDEGFHCLLQFPYTGCQLMQFTCLGWLSFLSPKLQCLCICQSLSWLSQPDILTHEVSSCFGGGRCLTQCSGVQVVGCDHSPLSPGTLPWAIERTPLPIWQSL